MKSIVFLPFGAYANSELVLDVIFAYECVEQDVSEYFSFKSDTLRWFEWLGMSFECLVSVVSNIKAHDSSVKMRVW